VGPTPPRLVEPFPRRVIRAANLYDALGEVTVATAAQPVAAVLLTREVAAAAPGRAVEAFHRVDPAVRLFLVTETPNGAVADLDGFDGVIAEPVEASRLEEALQQERRPGQSPAPNRSPAPPAPRAADAGPAPPPAPTRPASPPQVPAATLAPVQLGDTDLIEAVLCDPEGVRERAMRLMTQHTGWSDLRVGDEPALEGERSAEVRYGGRPFGTLRSRQASEGQLRPWAQWLARWLSLDAGYREFRQMAFHDELTGAGNRRFYDLFMRKALGEAARLRRPVTVLVFDIDDFKSYNDRFGHEAGDEILCETVRLLNSVIRAGDRVCRIGGDEFAVIFADTEGPREPGSSHPASVEAIAGRFQEQICRMKFPKLGLAAPGTLSVSGGLATYPWDGATAQDLLRHADQLALRSKRCGKNVITLGPGSRDLRPP
jgi:diguanylate cyclase (GGDEF)-like protein